MLMRTDLFVDRLSMTLDVPPRDQISLIHCLEGLMSQEILADAGPYSDLRKAYRHAFKFELANSTVTFQLEPYGTPAGTTRAAGARRFLRVQFNPAKARAEQFDVLGFIVEHLQAAVPSFTHQHLLMSASITGIDLTFDAFCRIESFDLFYILRAIATRRYSVLSAVDEQTLETSYHPNGLVNSKDYGKYDGDRYLVVYDKVTELRTCQIEGLSNSARGVYRRCAVTNRWIRYERPRTRFELSLNDVGNAANLLRMRNPFRRYTVRHLGAELRGLRQHEQQMFYDSCARRGLHQALSLIEDKSERKRFANAVRALPTPTWWEATRIWAELPHALALAFGVSVEVILQLIATHEAH